LVGSNPSRGLDFGVQGLLVDAKHRHLVARRVEVELAAGEAVIGVACRRLVARVGIKEAEHLVERPVLQHQLDDVLDFGRLVGSPSRLVGGVPSVVLCHYVVLLCEAFRRRASPE
jgi:hypothetical protein